MSKVLGIDLGTTNSAMAIYENGESKIIVNKEGKNTTPSVVAFTDKGEIIVGRSSKETGCNKSREDNILNQENYGSYV